ncbi:condensation domain-containing protein [Krasilnikovia sp. M28-CT-15]|uniref:condensation domain-containing protein n=1 Tax=Krasilnikovia sp. M28-CT-15 TaxID=3373540 RepID=UPI003876B3AF
MTKYAASGSSPLTFGQLSVLRDLQDLPAETWWQTYLCKSVALRPGTTLSDVTAALSVVSRRHDSLRTYFVGSEDEMVAVTVPSGLPPVEVIEMPDATEHELASTALQNCRNPFQWDREFAWRAFIFTASGSLRELVLVLDHMLVDGTGLRQLLAELRALLRGDDEEGRQLLASAPRQPRELAAAQGSELWSARRRAIDQYWDRLLDLPPHVFPWPTGQKNAGRVGGVLSSARTRAALGQVANRLSVTPQSIMLALTAIALAATLDQENVALSLLANNRYDPKWRHLVSSMNQITPVAVAVGRTDESFESFARRVHVAGLNAYRHGSYNVDDIAEKVRNVRGSELTFDVYFNFMAFDVPRHSEAPLSSFPEPELRLHEPQRQDGQRLDFRVRGGANMEIAMRADPTVMSSDTLSRLLAWYDEELIGLSRGERVGVKDSISRIH